MNLEDWILTKPCKPYRICDECGKKPKTMAAKVFMNTLKMRLGTAPVFFGQNGNDLVYRQIRSVIRNFIMNFKNAFKRFVRIFEDFLSIFKSSFYIINFFTASL